MPPDDNERGPAAGDGPGPEITTPLSTTIDTNDTDPQDVTADPWSASVLARTICTVPGCGGRCADDTSMVAVVGAVDGPVLEVITQLVELFGGSLYDIDDQLVAVAGVDADVADLFGDDE